MQLCNVFHDIDTLDLHKIFQRELNLDNCGAYLEKFKSLLQFCLAIPEQSIHFALTEKPLDFAAALLGLNKSMDLMEGPKFMWLLCQRDSTKANILAESSNMVQNIHRQLSTCIRLHVGNNDCIEQVVSFLH
jgi:hypothetical protein